MVFSFTKEQIEKLYFTSDQHFNHENIIKFCKRPFANAGEMDTALVANWNNTVPHDGVVFHLGDFCLGGAAMAAQYFESLNGKIYVLGIDFHHDKRWLQYVTKHPADPYRTYGGDSVDILPPEVSIEIESGAKYPSPTIHLSHYPISDWDRKFHGGWHLHGHSHGQYGGDNPLTGDLCWDVGVDAIGIHYKPVSFGAILEWAYESGWV